MAMTTRTHDQGNIQKCQHTLYRDPQKAFKNHIHYSSLKYLQQLQQQCVMNISLVPKVSGRKWINSKVNIID